MAVALLGVGPASAAERFYGVTAGNRLVTFNSDSPGAMRAPSLPVTGLGGARVLAIDVRPATGQLYGLADDGRLYRIDTGTGEATLIGSPDFEQGRRAVGFDFNPTVDKIRVVNDAGQNARVDPDTGALLDGDPDLTGAQPDRPLRYDAHDSGFGITPRLGGSAYTSTTVGATASNLYGIDQRRDVLVLQAPPNDGVLKTVGRLGVNAGGPVSFDIASSGRAFAAFARGTLPSVSLFQIKLSAGRAQRPARRNVIGSYDGTKRDPVQALAAAGPVPDDRTRPRVSNEKLNDPLIRELLKDRVLRLAVDCNEACDVSATFRLGTQVVGAGTGSVLGRAGRVVVRVKLTPSGKRLVRRERPKSLKVGFRVFDAAGNTVSTGR